MANLSKDNTHRGGARVGAGRKKKSLNEKILEGRLKKDDEILNYFEKNGQELLENEAVVMPSVRDYLSEHQKDGTDFEAANIFKETYEWLNKYGVAEIINPMLVEQYSLVTARYIQCEKAINTYGLIGKKNNNAVQSPFVVMSQNYMKQSNLLWIEIFQIVKENSTLDVGKKNPEEDMMEMILRKRGGNS